MTKDVTANAEQAKRQGIENLKSKFLKVNLTQREATEGESNDIMQMTQMTLPNRFGMYKTQKTFQRETQVEIEIPPFKPDDAQRDPNHKYRGIFDLLFLRVN